MINNKINLPFTSNINSQEFEIILNNWYIKTKKKNAKIIEFDFSRVTWCDIFELSLISLWILELIEERKRIIFYSPTNKRIRYFLSQYEFGKFLSQNKIENDLGYKEVKGDDLIISPRFPLKFYSEEIFLDLLNYLQEGINYNETFSDIIDCGIVNKAYLRNIILKELGDNMFRHAEGRFANFIMTIKSVTDPNNVQSKKEWSHTLQNSNSVFEMEFFQKLGGEAFFTLVFSDKGPGIFQKLKKDYEDNIKSEPNECDVLIYAFEKNSSSRDSKERLGELYEIINDYDYFSDNPPKLPPPTGLYMLLNIVREFHGFLYLRSGASIIAFDFYGNPNNKKIKRNDNIKALKNLTNFNGTQIKIHFPINIDLSRSIYNKEFIFPETGKNIQYTFVKITDYFGNNSDDNSEKISLSNFFSFIEKHYLNNKNNLAGLIVDLQDHIKISTKVLYILISKLMFSQNKDYTHVIINVQPQIIPSLKKVFSNIEENNYRPLILFDTNFNREILGVKKFYEILFENLFSKNVFDSKEDIEFIKKQDHLFIVDDGVALKHKRLSIFKTSRINLEERIRDIICDPDNKIYNPNVKVLMPSRAFCEGYFEIFNLVNQPNFRSILKQWFSYVMFEIKPNCIISISSHCKKVIDEIYTDYLNEKKSIKVKHYTIESPLSVQFSELYDISMKIGQNDKTIIFTDVIGTTTSISNILKHFIHIDELFLFSIINATEGSQPYIYIANKELSINHLVQKKLIFHQERPKGWTDDILLKVDPQTNNLIKKRVVPKKSLWEQKKDTNFIEHIIIKDNKYLIGHYTHDDTHLSYLFDIPLITQYHGEEIARIILDDLIEKISNKNQGKVIYLNDKHSLKNIGNYISRNLYFSLETVNNSDIVLIDDYESNEYLSNIIIAIDDAFDSGENVQRLIDFCARKKATEIHIYTIIKRGSNYSARKIYNINKYNGIEINFNYIAEIEIPTYKSYNCPICNRIFELKQVLDKISNNSNLILLYNYIENDINSIKEQRIASITDENKNFIKPDNIIDPLELYYRYYLQKAFYNLEYRDKIVSLIKDFKEKGHEVLILFKIISREKLFLVIDKKIEPDKYEDEFRDSVIEACIFFIEKANILKEEELDSVLYVLEHVDRERFLDKFYSLAKKTINSEKQFLQVIKHLYLNKMTFSYPQRIENVLSQLSNEKSNLPVINDLINNLHNIWENYISPSNLKVISYFDNLKTSNHEIIKIINRLNSLLSDSGSNPTITKSEITDLTHKLDDFLRYLKELSEFDFQNKLIIKNSEILINKLKKLQDRIKKLIYQNQIIDSRVFEKLRFLVSNINSEIYDRREYSLVSIIDLCETNIFHLINRLLEIEYPQKVNDDIKISFVVPEDIPTIAFGDQNGLEQIFHNIIDNKFKSKDINMIMCKIEFDKESNDILTYFMDDGELPNPIVKGKGNKICDKESRHYFGNYVLRKVNNDDVFAEPGYNSVAIVKLKCTSIN